MPFLSHSVSPLDSAVAARLSAVAAVNGIRLELPERGPEPRRRISPASRAKIHATDVVIGLVTRQSAYVDEVVSELNYALAMGKPVVLLAERGVPVSVPPDVITVEFDRMNPRLHEAALLQAVGRVRQSNRNQIWWLAAIGLGLLGLAAAAEPGPPVRPRKTTKKHTRR